MAAGEIKTGTSQDDTITGGNLDDTITGVSGNDSLSGGDGNDSLTGGAGYDTLDGGAGDDRIDLTSAAYGDIDLAYGGAGNDTITSSLGEEQIDGGAGDDVLTAQRGTIVGGTGADIITLSDGIASGGSGRDRFVIGALGNPDQGQEWSVTITDFAVGAFGDSLDLTGILSSLTGYTGGNPFGRFLWLEQSGNDTLLRLDRDGAGANHAAQTLVTFRNLTLSALNSGHFTGGFKPTTRIDNEIATLQGSDGDDTLAGGWGPDTITGGAGNDVISDTSSQGNNLSGDDGNDTITGGRGADTISGGDGNDVIIPGGGNDSVTGGNGDDLIDSSSSPDFNASIFDGGAGNDTIISGSGFDQLSGGDGNDILTTVNGTLQGGMGDDVLTLAGGRATGGGGRDRFVITDYRQAPNSISELFITDFTPGAGGDTLDLTAILSTLLGYKPGADLARYIWLGQIGANTHILIDEDSGGGQAGRTLAVLANVQASSLVAGNFAGGIVATTRFDQSDLTQTGTDAGETLVGGHGNDTIQGRGGNDFISDATGTNNLSGGSGNDTIRGGGINDVINGDDGNDALTGGVAATINGGDGADRISGGMNSEMFGGAGSDTLMGSTGSELLEGGDGSDVLQWYSDPIYALGSGDSYPDTMRGGAGNDIITNAGSGDLVFGDDGNDTLISTYGASTLDGGAGDDVIQASAGSLTGGAGADRFTPTGLSPLFGGLPVTTVTITDFDKAADVIDLSRVTPNLWNIEAGTPLGRYFYLVKDGSDTLLMVNADPLSQNPYVKTPPGALIRFSNIDPTALTARNFVQDFDPASKDFQPVTVTGGAGSDLLLGSLSNDRIIGGGGIDAVRYTGSADMIGRQIFIDNIWQSEGQFHYRVTDTRGNGNGIDDLFGVEIAILGNNAIPLRAPQPNTPYRPYDTTQFDEAAYLALYPDVAAMVKAGQYASGEAHYLAVGRAEFRASPARLDGTLVLFDESFYLAQNPDVAEVSGVGRAFRSAWEHYVQYGAREGRDPNIFFDTDWYLATNKDVAAAGMDALTHYNTYGWKEGRDPSRWFDTSTYLDDNPNVAAMNMNPLTHYLLYGYVQGRAVTISDLG